MESPTLTTDSSDTRLPSDAKGTPAPPSSQEPKGGKPGTVPVESPTAEPAAPAAEPVHPDQGGAAAVSGATAEPTSSPSAEATDSVYGQAPQNPYGEVQAQGSTSEKQPMKQVVNVDQAEASRLLLWGVALVLLSGVSAAIYYRLRRV
jgi:hypothetical protein